MMFSSASGGSFIKSELITLNDVIIMFYWNGHSTSVASVTSEKIKDELRDMSVKGDSHFNCCWTEKAQTPLVEYLMIINELIMTDILHNIEPIRLYYYSFLRNVFPNQC